MFACLTICTGTMCLLAAQFVLGLYAFACPTVGTGTMCLLASQFCTGTMCLLASQFVLGLCVRLPHSLYWD